MSARPSYRVTVEQLDADGRVYRRYVLAGRSEGAAEELAERQQRAHRMSRTRIIVESESGEPYRRVIGPIVDPPADPAEVEAERYPR